MQLLLQPMVFSIACPQKMGEREPCPIMEGSQPWLLAIVSKWSRNYPTVMGRSRNLKRGGAKAATSAFSSLVPLKEKAGTQHPVSMAPQLEGGQQEAPPLSDLGTAASRSPLPHPFLTCLSKVSHSNPELQPCLGQSRGCQHLGPQGNDLHTIED